MSTDGDLPEMIHNGARLLLGSHCLHEGSKQETEGG